tara:strand:+ start:1058 stop:2008 length:951 start_codon:yes stop_codon:yes gene_type:complete
MLIEFLDEEELALTEHTKVYIDEVYYDPDPSLSKMSIRMAMGTARFASGVGQKIKKTNIDIRTPTASIAIRGTDFTTTIDELGRSLVILLPDRFGDASGVIDVSNQAGTVTLEEAYAATMVATLDSTPTTPVQIQGITVNTIDNMFIVKPPTEVKQAIDEAARDDAEQDKGILDVDFLEFNELDTNELDKTKEDLEFTELDIDALSVDFLTDVLDVVEALDKVIRGSIAVAGVADAGAGTGGLNLVGATIGFNKDSQYNVFLEDERLIFFRDVNGVIEITFNKDSEVFLETIVDGYEGIITLNNGGAIEVVILQTN